MSYTAKEIKRLMGKAINEFEMIAAGDRLLVAVSGGQDSISLLWLLRERLERIPINHDIFAVHVDLGFKPDTAEKMKEFYGRAGQGTIT